MITRRGLLGTAAAVAAAGPPAARAQGAAMGVLWMGWPDPQVDPLMDAFRQAHPGAQLSVEKIPFAQIFQTIEVRLGARGPDPDILIVDSPLTASYAARGFLMPLDGILERDRFTAAGIATAEYDGKLYSAPFGSSSALLYYNRKLLADAGIAPPPAEPAQRWTWERIVEAGQKVAKPDQNLWGLVIEQAERPYQLLPLPQSLGAKAISDDGLTAKGYVDAPEMIQGFQFYQDLFQKWKISPPGVFDNNLTIEIFGTGKSAFFIGNTYDLDIIPQKYPALDFGVAPHPYFAAGRPVTPTGAWNIGVNARTDRKADAEAFVRFMMRTDTQRLWLKVRPYPPVLKQVWELEQAQFSTPGWLIVQHELANTAVPRPRTPGWREYEDILRVAIRDIQTGAPVPQRLADAAQRIDRELQKYRA
jgi:multiple sugar transport system substrate-binding protein